MEPRKNESEREREPRKKERKRRFQIVKLEERVAPRCVYHPQNGKYTGNCRGW
jgi:hypothetical protein